MLKSSTEPEVRMHAAGDKLDRETETLRQRRTAASYLVRSELINPQLLQMFLLRLSSRPAAEGGSVAVRKTKRDKNVKYGNQLNV